MINREKPITKTDVFPYFYLKHFAHGIGNVCFKELGLLVLIN